MPDAAPTNTRCTCSADVAGERPHAEAHVAPVRPLLLKQRDAAAMLGIGERSLERMVAGGEIPTVRVGRSIRYAVADLEAYVESLRGDRG